jgi:Ni/Co efflux regulator RcnB
MRKILFSLLLATTVATPALAQRHHDDSDRSEQSRPSRSEADHDRGRADRAQVRENRAEARANMEARGDMRLDNPAGGEAVARERIGFGGRAQVKVNERGRPTLGNGGQSNDSVAAWRGGQRDDARVQQIEREQRRQAVQQRFGRGEYTQQAIEQQRERFQRRAPAGVRPGTQAPVPRTASRDDRHHRWNPDWRRDHRYDWRSHRRHHRSIFHLGFYYDPFGWGYQRYSTGYRLWPDYYSSNYWLNDPSMYALPYAPFPYRWVRYYNDALLVNTYTGQVADVIYDFFW